jgi:regulator of protease activity HflC (stomatin/prohibitin superfamily)
VQVRIAVQYRVLLESAYDAYYRLSDPRGQIQSYVFDVVRSTVPKMELDEAFASKQDIADATLLQLKDVMQNYVRIDKCGYCCERFFVPCSCVHPLLTRMCVLLFL